MSGNGADREPLRFISIKEVSRRVGYVPQHIRRLIAAGEFPAPVDVGSNKIGFVEEEVTAWQREKIARRDAKRPKDKGDGCAAPASPVPRPKGPAPNAGVGLPMGDPAE